MSVTDDIMNTLTAQWYNTLITGLNMSASDFQLTQASLELPAGSKQLWDTMDQVATDSIAQFYDPSTIGTFSGEYQTILGDVQIQSGSAFETAMGTNYVTFMADWKTYAMANSATVFSNPPSSSNAAQMKYFDQWSSLNMDPGAAATCSTLLAATHDNPFYIAQQLIQNLAIGAEVPFTLGQKRVLALLAGGQARSFSMASQTASSDVSNSWSNSFQSAGGTYFYTKTSSSQATDFSQKVASSAVNVANSFAHVANIPILPLSTGNVIDGGTTYLPWYYGAALIAAYQDPTATTWKDPANWAKFFGPSGSLQYVATALIVADGISQTITSDATFSSDEQTYAAQQNTDDYGCWPYYVKNDSASQTSTVTTFDASGHMTSTVTSPVGKPVVIGMLVSSIKSLATSVASS